LQTIQVSPTHVALDTHILHPAKPEITQKSGCNPSNTVRAGNTRNLKNTDLPDEMDHTSYYDWQEAHHVDKICCNFWHKIHDFSHDSIVHLKSKMSENAWKNKG
jgi:hypothetical protein